ncbi:MAG TPA: hypothetical protein VIH47_02955 [Solirubrobacterales bacterium]
MLLRPEPSTGGALPHRVEGARLAGALAAGAGALLVGASAATGHGAQVGGILVVLIFCGIAVATYLKEPLTAFIGLWLLIVFTSPLSAVLGYQSGTGEAVRQVDEVLVFLFVLLTLRRTLLSNAPWPPLRYVAAAAGVAVFGVISAIVHGVPTSTMLVGAVLGLKLWIMVIVTLMLPWKRSDGNRVYVALMSVGVLVAVLGLVDYATHGAISRSFHTSNYNVGMGAFRSEAVHSIFPTPGEYSLFMSLLFAVSFSRFASQVRRQDLLLAVLFAASIVLSLRLKGFLSLAVVIAIVGVAQGATSARRTVIVLLLGSLVIVGAYVFEKGVVEKQVTTYSSSESSPRSRLYRTGEKIAATNFPLGVGFGRYASYPSRTSYSPVYYQYRLNDVYGLSPEYPAFIDDTSWPSVMGETGYGGFACYLVGLVMLAWAVVRRLPRYGHRYGWLPLSALCMIAAVLVDSLGDPTLFSWLAAATLALILGPALSRDDQPMKARR